MSIEIKQQKQTHSFNPGILRAYDIRGTVDESLNETDCYFIGRSFGTIVVRAGGRKVCLGYDGRASSPLFAAQVSKGLQDCGLEIENVGLGPTPMVYYALYARQADACAIITGSHSPLSYNGIKMALKDGPFYGAMIQELQEIAQKGSFATGAGSERLIDVQQNYADRLAKEFSSPKALRVAWDNGNGAGGEILRRLVKNLPGEHFLLYDEIDSRFPNHHPDPTIEENLKDLKDCVLQNNCDLGVAFDGDGDRVGAVDEKGNFMRADRLMALYAAEILHDHPGTAIVADVKCSNVLFDEIKRLNGRAVMSNTGHSLIKAKMIQEQALMAGELTGHICFADRYDGFDDGIYAAVRLINLVAKSGKPLSALMAHLPSMHNTPEIRLFVPAERKFAIPTEILERLKSQNNQNISINDIDGVRVTTQDGWWLIRASNTEDMISLRAEAFDENGLNRLQNHLREQLALCGVDLHF